MVVDSAALPSRPAVSDGVTVLVTLYALQVLLAALRQRSSWVRRALDFTPGPSSRTGAQMRAAHRRARSSRSPTSSPCSAGTA